LADHFGPTPQSAGHVFSEPDFIAASASSSFFWTAALMSDFLSWKSATPMPSFVASKLVLPAFAEPAAIA
jgi:hypothetical protein